MESFSGQDLGELIKSQGKLSLTQTLPLVHQIAAVLDYATRKGKKPDERFAIAREFVLAMGEH